MKKPESDATTPDNGSPKSYEPPQLIETVRLKSIVQQFPTEPPPPG